MGSLYLKNCTNFLNRDIYIYIKVNLQPTASVSSEYLWEGSELQLTCTKDADSLNPDSYQISTGI